MRSALWFAVGVGVGAVVVARLRHNETSCARRVAAGVREEVTDRFGAPGGLVYDFLGLGNIASPLLDALGVPYDA